MQKIVRFLRDTEKEVCLKFNLKFKMRFENKQNRGMAHICDEE
jgi:hypothetical protein